MTTRLFLRDTTTMPTTGDGIVHDMLPEQGSPYEEHRCRHNDNTYAEVCVWVFEVEGIEGTQFPYSINVPATAGSVAYRWRIQRRSASGAVIASSAYSPERTTTGITTGTLTLDQSWNDGDLLALSLEVTRFGGHGNVDAFVAVQDASSYVDAQLVEAAPPEPANGTFGVESSDSVEWVGSAPSIPQAEGTFAIESSDSVEATGSVEVSGSFAIESDDSIEPVGFTEASGEFVSESASSVLWTGSTPEVGVSKGTFDSEITDFIEFSGDARASGSFDAQSSDDVTYTGSTEAKGSFDVALTDDVIWTGRAPTVGEASGTFSVNATDSVSADGSSDYSGEFVVSEDATVGWVGFAPTSDAHGTFLSHVDDVASATGSRDAAGSFDVSTIGSVEYVGRTAHTGTFEVVAEEHSTHQSAYGVFAVQDSTTAHYFAPVVDITRPDFALHTTTYTHELEFERTAIDLAFEHVLIDLDVEHALIDMDVERISVDLYAESTLNSQIATREVVDMTVNSEVRR